MGGEEPQRALPKGSNPRCGVPGVALKAPKPDENPSGVQGKGDDAMKTSNHINLYES